MKEIEVEKHSNDKLNYKGFELKNGIKLIIAQNKEIKLSACSFLMDVGFFDCSKNFQGTPHFLEHMLTFGSKKYPDPLFFQNFINENGGYENAYTSDTSTNYYFSIKNESLIKSIEIFMSYLIDPILSKDMIDKEINAIESEFNVSINSDKERKEHLLKYLSYKESLFNNFSNGNNITLKKEGIYEELSSFFKNKYNSDKLSIAIVTNSCIEDIQNNVIELLEEYKFNPNNLKLNLSKEIKPFDDKNLKKIIQIKNIKKHNKLELNFMLEDISNFHNTKPWEYYVHLFGHESRGSIIYELKEKNYATSLLAYYESMDNYFSYLSIEIKLTELGFENYKKIINYVFCYIDLIKKKGVQKYIWEEISKIKNMKYIFKSNKDEINKVNFLSESIKEYGVKYANSLYYKMDEYNEEIIERFNNFNLENCLIFWSSNKLENLNKKEEIYNIEYDIEDINFQLENIENNLGFPEKNFLIPSDFEMINKCNEFPELVYDEKFTKIYLNENNKFKNPKIIWDLVIKFSNMDEDILYKKLWTNLWIKIFNEYSNDFLYQASMALIKFDLNLQNFNLILNYNGFTDSFDYFIKNIFEKTRSFSEDLQNGKLKQQFNLVYNEYKQKYFNSSSGNIHKVTFNTYNKIMTNYNNTFYENYEILEKINYDNLREFDKIMFNEIKFEILINGNILKENSLNLINYLEDFTKNKNSKILVEKSNLKIYNFIKEVNFVSYLPKKEKNNAYLMSIYLGNERIHKYFCYGLVDFLNNNYYKDLRTKQQICYNLYCSYNVIRGHYYLIFYIQSNIKHSLYLKNKTYEYIEEQKKLVLEMTNEKLKDIVMSSIINFKKNYLSLSEQNTDWIVEIINKKYLWNKKNIYYDEILNLDFNKFKDIVKSQIVKENFVNILIVSDKFKENFLKDSKSFIFDTNFDKIWLNKNFLNDNYI